MPKVAAAGDWLARPFDDKCKERGPLDEVVVGQIRMVIPDWSPGDWEAVLGRIAGIIPHLLPMLPTMTVRAIGQAFHGHATRHLERPHTANTTVVQCPPIVAPAGSPWAPSPVVVEMPKSKRSTANGEARDKLVAKLTEHHRYADDSCLNDEPIGNNDLARGADVSKSTASAFFEKEFGGWESYRGLCGSTEKLVAALKLLNGEFTPRVLLRADAAG